MWRCVHAATAGLYLQQACRCDAGQHDDARYRSTVKTLIQIFCDKKITQNLNAVFCLACLMQLQ
jgi:hypothetical protein